jgi:hypothetical protein
MAGTGTPGRADRAIGRPDDLRVPAVELTGRLTWFRAGRSGPAATRGVVTGTARVPSRTAVLAWPWAGYRALSWSWSLPRTVSWSVAWS